MEHLCNVLEAVTRGELKIVIINVPPGSSKTTIVSLCWPTWEWLRYPERRWLCASYEFKPLSTLLNVKRRDIITSRRYRLLLRPDWKLKKGQREKSLFVNDREGWMRAISPDTGSTGDHGDRMIIDDPIKPRDIYGPKLEEVNRWWRETASSRFRDPKNRVVVLVMQRLHDNDLSELLSHYPGVTQVVIPAFYEKQFAEIWDPRMEEGESFFPKRFPTEIIPEKKEELGSYQFSAQFQQRPLSAEGNVIKVEWWVRWTRLPNLREAIWIGVWDTAYEKGKKNDYTVGQVWVAVGRVAYLLDQVRGKFAFNEMERKAVLLARRWPQVPFWNIETRAMGPGLVERLQINGVNVRSIKSQECKEQRTQAILPLIENGQVCLPAEDAERPDILAPKERWSLPDQIPEFIKEHSAFPNLNVNDDQVDCTTMGVGHLARYLQAPASAPTTSAPIPSPVIPRRGPPRSSTRGPRR